MMDGCSDGTLVARGLVLGGAVYDGLYGCSDESLFTSSRACT